MVSKFRWELRDAVSRNGLLAVIAIACLGLAAILPAANGAAAEGVERPEPIPAPDLSAPLDERWTWALGEAEARQAQSYWIAYAIERAVVPGLRFMSDSEERWFNGTGRRGGVPLAALLGDGASSEGTIVQMFRLTGRSNGAIDRIARGSATLSMDFGGLPVFWLGQATDEQSVPWLESLLDRLSAERLREEAAEALALHAASALVLPALDRILGGEYSEGVRAQAAEGLSHHSTADSLALAGRTAADDRSPLVRREAAEAIGGIHAEGAGALLVELAIGSSDAGVRAEAAEAAGEQPAAEALPALERIVFEAPDPQTREEGIEALGSFGADALPLLRIVIWEHPDPGARTEAVETLGDLGTTEVLSLLAEVVELHDDALAVDEALDVMEELDAPRARALLLSAAENNPVARVRREAVERLGDIGEDGLWGPDADAVIRLLERAAFLDPDPGVRREAADALEELQGR